MLVGANNGAAFNIKLGQRRFMAISTTRLTLFALLSAVEEDMRNLIVASLDNSDELTEILGENYDRAIERLRHDPQVDDEGEFGLADLLFYLDLGHLCPLLNQHRDKLSQEIGVFFRQKTELFSKLIPVRNRIAHTRPLLTEDFPLVVDSCSELANSELGIWDSLRTTQANLKDNSSFVLTLEIPNYESIERPEVSHNLPIPEFDDTGFIGRSDYVDEIKKQCLGPYPVVSITGDGGWGKTAVALKVAYDLIDSADCPFEAIVWVSCKTSQLSQGDFVRIENSIADSLGVFKQIVHEVAGDDNPKDPMAAVIECLQTFKILLVIDNLETVLDERIKSFLSLLPVGSKVLITSRIGVGAFEFPIKLTPMNKDESVRLMRSIAKVRYVSQLTGMSNARLEKYCRRMNFNPLHIKWFIAGVQAGRRPEEILANSGDVLDFCMSNVFQFLSESAQQTLISMQAVPHNQTVAELSYINDLEPGLLVDSLHELTKTSLISQTITPSGATYESRFGVTTTSRKYLNKNHSLSSESLDRINRLRQKLASAHEDAELNRQNPYSPRSIASKSTGELVVTKYLQDALNHSKSKEYSLALDKIDDAKKLAPDFFEVHRIEAWIKVLQNDISSARTCYQKAIEIEPEHAPLRYFYGQFLMRSWNDVEASLEQFTLAAEIDPNSAEVKIETARCKLYLSDFEVCRNVLEEVESEQLSHWMQRKLHDLTLQSYSREAYRFLDQHNTEGAVVCFEGFKHYFENEIDPNLVDKQMLNKVENSTSLYFKLKSLCVSEELSVRLQNICSWIDGYFPISDRVETEDMRPRVDAEIVLIYDKFAFAKSDNGSEYYVNRRDLGSGQRWSALSIGSKVSFETKLLPKGPAAKDLKIER